VKGALLRAIAGLAVLGAVAAGAAAKPAAEQAAGTITTVAGTGVDGVSGDGGPATAAAIDHPRGIAVLRDGSFVFAQPFTPMIRRVAPDGTISTVAGTGEWGYSGDGGPATVARLSFSHGVAAMPDGGFVIADMGNSLIRRVWPDGRITTVVGTGAGDFSGDNGPATAAAIAFPRGVAARPDGELLIPDTENHRVRRVAPDGVITTVAGNGDAGLSGDGGPAVDARLSRPFGVAPLRDGGFLIADVQNDDIRRVWPNGTITTVAGTGTAGFSGDGGPATSAALDYPHAVAALPDGGFLIADTYNNRVRRVWPDGTITTIAGTGTAGFSGDGGPPAAAQLNMPKALAVLPDESGFYVGDSANNRVRLVSVDLHPALKLRVLTKAMHAKTGKQAVLRYALSDEAEVTVLVRRQARDVLHLDVKSRSGTNRLLFGKRLHAGSYRVTLTASTSEGRSARAAAALRILP
jgi:glucose/arabinose dehydrogenase